MKDTDWRYIVCIASTKAHYSLHNLNHIFSKFRFSQKSLKNSKLGIHYSIDYCILYLSRLNKRQHCLKITLFVKVKFKEIIFINYFSRLNNSMSMLDTSFMKNIFLEHKSCNSNCSLPNKLNKQSHKDNKHSNLNTSLINMKNTVSLVVQNSLRMSYYMGNNLVRFNNMHSKISLIYWT